MPVSASPLRLLSLLAAAGIGLSPARAEPAVNSPVPSLGRKPAAAATTTAPTTAPPPTSFREQPMQPRLVRDGRSGCGDSCAEWIAAEGRIVAGTAEAFAGVLRGLAGRRLPVFVDSGGGAVADAMAMGRLIRAQKLDVAVAETIPDCAGCGPDRAQPRSPGALCASACVLVLAAGVARVGGLATHVGVHQMSMTGVRIVKRRLFRIFYRTAGGVKREVGREIVSERTISTTSFTEPASQATDDRVARYLDDMGIGAGLMPLMLSTPSTRIRWLTPNEERGTSLLTATSGGEALLAHRPRDPSPPLAPAKEPERDLARGGSGAGTGAKAPAALPPSP